MLLPLINVYYYIQISNHPAFICLFLLYGSSALNTVPVLVEVCREDDVWLGGLFLGDSFSGLCSIVRHLAKGDFSLCTHSWW